MLSKRRRQQLVVGLVGKHRVGTQIELTRRLSRAGVEVTQATVSRDIRELGLRKVRDEMGNAHYSVADDDEPRDPVKACRNMLEEFAISITPAQNLVVVRSESGTAPGLGRVLDELQHELVIGTVAREDRVVVVTSDQGDADSLAGYLGELV